MPAPPIVDGGTNAFGAGAYSALPDPLAGFEGPLRDARKGEET